MKIHFERTGGFAGIKISTSFDAAALPRPQARQLSELMAKARFFELPLKLEASSPGMDRFQYKLTVETEGQARTVEASDSAVPGELRPLLDWLTRFARR
jgi:hypothetical protein